MIAACPECRTQYRVDPQRLTSEGVRLRCTRCQTVFRVRAAQPPAPAPSARPAAEARPAPPPAPAPARPSSAPPPAHEAAPPPIIREAAPPPIIREAAPPPIIRQAAPPPVGREASSPPAPAPAASGSNALSERLVLVATPDAEKAKDWSEALRGWGLEAETAHDGVEALLKIHRRWPSAVVMDPQLPKMFGFQVCEVIKRNESLRRIGVVLIGAIHHPERYRRGPTELYGADAYVEEPDLPEALAPILRDLGLPLGPGSGPPRPSARPAARFPAGEPTLPPAPRFPAGEATMPAPRFPVGEATMPPVPPEATLPPRPPPPLPEPLAAVEDALEPAPEAELTLPPVEVLREPEPVAPPPRRAPAPPPHPAPAPPPRRVAPAPMPAVEIAPEPAPAIGSPEFDVIDPDAASAEPPLPPAPAPRAPAARSAPAVDPEVEKAERLARIIVSDVVLYNEEKFRAACAAGNVMEVLEADLADGRAHFAARVPERVRQARDFLGDELLRVARSRGMA